MSTIISLKTNFVDLIFTHTLVMMLSYSFFVSGVIRQPTL